MLQTGEEVGWEEAQQQKEKSANSQQIKRIAKTIFNMSVAMGLGAGGSLMHSSVQSQAMAQMLGGCWEFFW